MPCTLEVCIWNGTHWEQAGLAKLSVGADRIGQNSFGTGWEGDFIKNK